MASYQVLAVQVAEVEVLTAQLPILGHLEGMEPPIIQVISPQWGLQVVLHQLRGQVEMGV